MKYLLILLSLLLAGCGDMGEPDVRMQPTKGPYGLEYALVDEGTTYTRRKTLDAMLASGWKDAGVYQYSLIHILVRKP